MKKIVIWLSIILLLTMVVTIVALPLISSYMQAYYKSQLDGTQSQEFSEEVLNKKALWARVGESIVPLYLLPAEVLICVVVGLVCWKRRNKDRA